GFGAVLSGRRRWAAVLSGAALMAGSLCTRMGIFEAGMASARDPRYTVVPQRERLDRGEPVRFERGADGRSRRPRPCGRPARAPGTTRGGAARTDRRRWSGADPCGTRVDVGGVAAAEPDECHPRLLGELDGQR